MGGNWWGSLYNNWVVAVVVMLAASNVATKQEYNGVGSASGAEVTYDGRSLIVDAQRKILFSGSIHYPRSTPQMWPSLIASAKEGGLDVIQTYVFWNLHEPQPGQYDFSGRYDLVRFIKQIEAHGLYVCLRIGPFIESEWTYGGLPFWLHDVPGIIYRSDNEPFKFYMQSFTTKIVNMMKSEGLYASQGGPIILSQIENEYQNVEAAFHEKGPSYVVWAAKMAVELNTGVPWLMCKQTDAPDPIINTCNGMRCGETFGGPNSPNKPSMWTENWTSFYQVYGGEPYIRSAEDIAFHVALFVAKNGSYINYYMYHGGTNFGRTSSSYVTTSYYDQAPIDEYGLLRQPKWGHLKDLHASIKSSSTAILEGKPSNFSLGNLQEAYIFREDQTGGGCVAFLVNNDGINKATVQFQNSSLELLPKSISILQDCEKEIYNTAKVSIKENRRMTRSVQLFDSTDNVWERFQDVIPSFEDDHDIDHQILKSNSLLEHMNVTKDKSDYLWYSVRFDYNISDLSCSDPKLQVESLGHVIHVFSNSKYVGGAHGSHDVKGLTRLESPILLNDGVNNISVLSVMAGLPDSGAFLERRVAGLTSVQIYCSSSIPHPHRQPQVGTGQGPFNLSGNDYTWAYQVGLVGEKMEIYRERNTDSVEWSKGIHKALPLSWYRTRFDAPTEMGPEERTALNLGSMGKGEAWINGESIGRYWVSFVSPKSGGPSQSLYHVPLSLLKPQANLLVLVEEESSSNPLQISLETVSVSDSDEKYYYSKVI